MPGQALSGSMSSRRRSAWLSDSSSSMGTVHTFRIAVEPLPVGKYQFHGFGHDVDIVG